MDDPIFNTISFDPGDFGIHGFCERCGISDSLISCIGPSGELLARICNECATEYMDSGIDEL